MKTSFKTRVSQMGLGSFMNINIFVIKYYFFQFVYILHFFESLKSKSTQMLRPQKGNLGVSFNDTLLNFGLRGKNLKEIYRVSQTKPGHETGLALLSLGLSFVRVSRNSGNSECYGAIPQNETLV